MKKPILLLKNELIKPINQALERIENIQCRKCMDEDEIVLEGLFILTVSSFENSLIDTLKIILLKIPEKLNIKNETISKKVLIDEAPLRQVVEDVVNLLSYKNLEEILNYFLKTIGIGENLISSEHINSMQEIKATRNLLIHNNLIENSFYKETAGLHKRNPEGGTNKLPINQNYLYNSILTLKSVLDQFKFEMLNKYSNYTRINAVKKLFNYIFQTPVMKFENEFETNLENDCIGSLKSQTSRNKSLSSSEKFYYDLWVSHSHSIGFKINSGQFYSISDKNKFNFFIENIDLLKS